jgi:hypothetical protein
VPREYEKHHSQSETGHDSKSPKISLLEQLLEWTCGYWERFATCMLRPFSDANSARGSETRDSRGSGHIRSQGGAARLLEPTLMANDASEVWSAA